MEFFMTVQAEWQNKELSLTPHANLDDLKC